jgi:hypothetical protein
MTCHSRANFDTAGKSNSGAGFDNVTGNASFGPVNPSWYWNLVAPDGNLAAPSVPLYQNIPVLQRVALSADFIWSIPFCAIDDTTNPPETKSRCAGK